MHRIRYTLSLILGTILISPTTAPPAVAQEQEAGHCPGRLEAPQCLLSPAIARN